MTRLWTWATALIVALSLSLTPSFVDAKPPKAEKSAKEKSGKSKSAKKKKKQQEDKEASSGPAEHVVKKGETVSKIAKKYGVRDKDIVRWNKLKNPDKLKVGQVLKIRAAEESSSKSSKKSDGGATEQRKTVYVVRKGDTLSKIAKKNKVSVDQLKKWNSALRKNPDKLKVGQQVVVWVEAPVSGKQASVGAANKGSLVGGEKLESGKGYTVRNGSRSYGTSLTISTIMSVMGKYAAKYPKGAKFVVGDLSFKNGGKMSPHKSHQTGRDVDISYAAADNEQLDGFVKMKAGTFDVAKNWYVIKSFVDTGDVQYIFVDYKLQELLYDYAIEKGVSESYLEKVLQYPRGKRDHDAIVRHAKGHADHMHVRFVCPKGDSSCK